MHRAVLMAKGPEVDEDAVILAAPPPASADAAASPGQVARAEAAARATVNSLVGRTVADVERELIIDTVYHCLGNRTHAANILGISIRTLRNKLKQYGDEGQTIPMPGEYRAAI